nr:hypothetical protein CFP56_00793 [Quercus suber]
MDVFDVKISSSLRRLSPCYICSDGVFIAHHGSVNQGWRFKRTPSAMLKNNLWAKMLQGCNAVTNIQRKQTLFPSTV